MPNKQRLEELQNYTDKIANRINQLRCQQRGPINPGHGTSRITKIQKAYKFRNSNL